MERFNGKASFSRRTHGSERRGVTPVPDTNFAYQLHQSRKDRERVIELMNKHRERIHGAEEDYGLGNRELPAFKHKAELVANIESHKAVIVGGETGSGKSTQLPQYLYEAGYDMTLVLVPRRIIADGLGDRIREELSDQIEDFKPEETVGIIHGERVERHEDNKIVVMTPNTFIKMAKDFREQYGDKKVAIIADEIHEANLFTEIAAGVAALSVEKHDSWRLVAASATHNAETLQRPFQKLNDGYVPTVEIKGRPFTVELQEEPELSPMQAYARDGHNHQKSMIFTSGKKEIEHIINETRRELEKREKNASSEVVFRVLHGELTEFELSHIDDPVPEGRRLVIVSSPAGMSGITIPGVTYVATDGTINRSELDDENAEGLRRRYLSRAGVTQQIGRAGRDTPGGIGVLCAPVMTERPKGLRGRSREDTDKLVGEGTSRMPYVPFAHADRGDHEPPEIYNTNLSRIVLSVASADYDFSGVNEYIPHPVQKLSIIAAEKALARLGALDADRNVTSIGRYMDKFPIIPELARGLYEASRRNTVQHMARAAFIAAAVDVGGLEDHRATADATMTRKQLIRPTTADDFIAQLDLMTKLYERTDEEWNGYDFVERHGLHPKRVERVRKSARKILGVMKLHPQNIVVTAPIPDEERALREDFTAGFLDLIHEDVGTAPRSRKVIYRNIHGSSESKVRTISDRSSSTITRHQLVAGIPRYYMKGERKDGTSIKHDIIDHVFIVDPAVVGRFAVQNNLIHGTSKPSMEGDQLVDYEQGSFGSILVGAPKKHTNVEVVSKEGQEVLVNYVLKNQGRVQRALRDLANELQELQQRTPAEILDALRNPSAPADITQETVTEMIRNVVSKTTSAHGVENQLAEMAYSGNITLAKYFDPESVQKLKAMSPQQIALAGDIVPLRYEDGVPYIAGATKRQLSKTKEPIFLPDGREVLRQRMAPDGGKERVSFGRQLIAE
ncbi:MAG: DEAD/DEAH box helicase family protein [Candidatus Microsaccharimonas sp.]